MIYVDEKEREMERKNISSIRMIVALVFSLSSKREKEK